MMLKNSITLAIISFIFCGLHAQTTFSLVGEGTGSKVSVLYHIDKWSANLDGVNIKRRIIKKNGKPKEWELLNSKLLVPSNELTKDLSNVTNNPQKTAQLEKLRIQYFKSTAKGLTHLQSVTVSGMKKRLSKPNAFNGLKPIFLFDYDIALMHGFGFVDYNLPKAYAVQYGVFSVYEGVESETEAATYLWVSEVKPDLSLSLKKEKIKKKKLAVELSWVLDTKEYDKSSISGFNVYRKALNKEYVKLNDNIIWISKYGSKRMLYYKDTLPNLETDYVYAMVPVSAFKTEGEYYEQRLYSDLPDETPAPVIVSEIPYGYDFVKKGVELKWEFDPRLEDRINGFIVTRGIESIDYVDFNDTLSPDTRFFTDKSLRSQEGVQSYYYKIKALQKGSYSLTSNRLSLYYDPYPEPSFPGKLTAEVRLVSGEAVVSLSWTEDAELMKQIKGYRFMTDFGATDVGLAYSQGDPLITSNDHRYIADINNGKKHKFSINIVDKKNRSFPYTDTVELFIPSLFLPFVEPKKLEMQDNNITARWDYLDRYADLAGFRMYVNGKVLFDETQITADKREWELTDLEPGKYHIKLQAVTQYGLTSEISPYGRAEVIKKE